MHYLVWEFLKTLNDMANDYFQFKQFIIKQDRCAMKVGTDSVLIGAWAEVGQAYHVLDIGTGSGIIAIMIAQRSEAHIDAIEIEEQAYLQSIENFSNCTWNNRINSFHIDLKSYADSCLKKYDLIISNPPFFIKSYKTNHHQVNLARHNDQLPFCDLIYGADKLLTDNGRFSLVLPFAEGSIFIAEAVKKGLFCIRKTSVKPKHNTPVKRLLLEFSRVPAHCEEDFLVIVDNENDYTLKYKTLTKDFYLFV